MYHHGLQTANGSSIARSPVTDPPPRAITGNNARTRQQDFSSCVNMVQFEAREEEKAGRDITHAPGAAVVGREVERSRRSPAVVRDKSRVQSSYLSRCVPKTVEREGGYSTRWDDTNYGIPLLAS
ncbi:uncharacterized protein LAJ45_00335 [Morchella importuna]|uniref:uncharacterized protein n=1 Tax=Morchella importuna TaxID=1174673 RepID=UPI001E8CF8AE|nr:uncharacterized protein LAJ45_00335 [Morchella importuna]KAH8155325.1 hypothetical protein LAJ45_00335 [Morchella importuna]